MTFSSADIQLIRAEIIANRKLLESCLKPHDFSIGVERYEGSSLFRDYRCTKCSGKVTSSDKLWYERGLAHGKDIK
jgi:hypothetical protein